MVMYNTCIVYRVCYSVDIRNIHVIIEHKYSTSNQTPFCAHLNEK